MKVDVSWRVTAGGRGLAVTGDGAPLAEFAFGLPAGERVTALFDELDGLRHTEGSWEACLRHFPSDDGWSSVLSLDNRSPDEQPLPPLGVAVTLSVILVAFSFVILLLMKGLLGREEEGA